LNYNRFKGYLHPRL